MAGRRGFGAFGAVMGMALLAGAARAATPADPTGEWQTADNGGVVQIETCGGGKLCGRLVGFSLDHPSDKPPTDNKGQSECGLTILSDARRTGSDIWQGQILDPRNGKVYHAEMWMDGNGQLHLRGYLGVPLLGRTVVWHRYNGPISPDCRIG